jgi:hypothetical protein
MQLLMGNANSHPLYPTGARTKMKRTAKRKGALKAKPAKVQPPQHEHTDNITFLGVGVSDDGERFLDVAVRENSKVAVEEKSVLLKVNNLIGPASEELKLLSSVGAALIIRAAQTEFLARAHDAARAEPTFAVATKTGWHGADFVLPEGLAPQGQANVARYFDPRYRQYHRRLQQAGTIPGWLELAALCRGKTRLMAGLCLSFTGPVCGEFGYEPPGGQLVAAGGLGKTTIGRVVATPWGGDLDPARRIGCGVSWNNTNLNLEVVAAAHNQMQLFLDEMHRADKQDVEKIIELMNGEGRGRSTETRYTSFCLPIVSTSNLSGISIARELGMMKQIEALIDRFADIPLPNGCRYMFEGIRTPQELRDYGDELRRLSLNFGWAGPKFVRRFGAEIEADRASVQAFVDARRRTYRDAGDRLKSLRGRDLTRITDKFATSYIAGCLAIRYQILPFTEAEILAALLTCERDHVAFVDQELRFVPAHFFSAHGATAALVPHPALAGAVTPTPTPFDRLQRFINRNRRSGLQSGFIDIRSSRFAKIRMRRWKGLRVLGYHAAGEYWIPGDRFEEVAGGSHEALALKKELFRQGLLVTDRRGNGVSYVVKRPLPDGTRPFLVVLRHRPKK